MRPGEGYTQTHKATNPQTQKPMCFYDMMTLTFYFLKGMSSLSLRQQVFEIKAHVRCFSKKHFRESSIEAVRPKTINLNKWIKKYYRVFIFVISSPFQKD